MGLILTFSRNAHEKIDALLQIIRNFERHKLSEIAEKLGGSGGKLKEGNSASGSTRDS